MQGELGATEASREELSLSLGELDCLVADLQVERTDLMQQLAASQHEASASCRRADGLEAQLVRAAGEAQQAAREAGEMLGQVQEAQAAAAAARDATGAAENKVRPQRDLSLGRASLGVVFKGSTHSNCCPFLCLVGCGCGAAPAAC